MSNNEFEQILTKVQELVSAREWLAALDALDEATRLDHECAVAWYQKGKILNRLGKIEEALEAFDKVIDINPEDTDGWYNKGVCLTKLGKTEESLEAYREASRLNPVDSSAQLEGVDFMGILGKDQAALESLERVASRAVSRSDDMTYTNSEFQYEIALEFVWEDGEKETLQVEDLSSANVMLVSTRYPHYSLAIEAKKRIPCNYPAKELVLDLAAELTSEGDEGYFYAFPNGQLPAYAVKSYPEHGCQFYCDIVVTNGFAYQLRRTVKSDEEAENEFAKRIVFNFQPLRNE